MSETTPEQNKAIVLEAIETLLNKHDYAAAERFLVARLYPAQCCCCAGARGALRICQGGAERAALRDRVDRRRDYVMVHGRISGIGQPANWVVVDIVRIENGLIAEHWDVIQDEATRVSSKSGRPMFGASFPPDGRPSARERSLSRRDERKLEQLS